MLASALLGFSVGGMTVHRLPIMHDAGLTLWQAARYVFLIDPASPIGNLAAGWLLDRAPVLDDSVSTLRGLALKIIGVEGERLPGSEGQTSQDLAMRNAPAFSAPNPKKFASTLKLLAKTTDTPQVLKKALSLLLRGAEAVMEKVSGPSPTLNSLGGHPNTHILGAGTRMWS